MRWFPVIEVLNDAVWTLVPNEALTGSVGVSLKHGQASTASFTVRTSAIPGGVDAWVFKRVRIAFMYAPTVADSFARKDLFDGFIQGLSEQAVVGLTSMECTSITTRVFKKSAALLAQLESMVPWSEYVFGVRGELSAEAQFEKLLNASDFTLTEAGLVPLDTLLHFTDHRPGTGLGPETEYDHYHRVGDVIAGGAGSVGTAISLQRSDPKVSAPADDPRYELLPDDVRAKPPVNEIKCIVRHRSTRLCQETFVFDYEGGNLAVDWVEKNSRFLTKDVTSSAYEQAGLRPVGVQVEVFPPPSGTDIVAAAEIVPFVIDDALRLTYLYKFTHRVARRYIQPVEKVYQKTIRAEQSIARYGLQTETRALTIEDEATWEEFTDWKLLPTLAETGYVEVCTAQQFTELGKVGKGTQEAALLALGALVGEAKRAIKVAHTPMLSGAIGSNAAITTAYKVPMTAASLAMATGETCALDTPFTTVDGLITSLVFAMDASGSATCAVELTTSVKSNGGFDVPPVEVPEGAAVAVSKGYRDNPLPSIGAI